MHACMHAYNSPITVPDATSSGPSTSVGSRPVSGCEQHVFVHTEGNVIFSFALCWRSSLPSVLKRKTEKARCSLPRGRSGQKMCVSYLLSVPTPTIRSRQVARPVRYAVRACAFAFVLACACARVWGGGGHQSCSDTLLIAKTEQLWRQGANESSRAGRKTTDDIVVHVEQNTLVLLHEVDLRQALAAPCLSGLRCHVKHG